MRWREFAHFSVLMLSCVLPDVSAVASSGGGGLSITTATIATPVVGQAYSQTIATSGGVAPIAFSINGSLPSGLTLNGATGVIQGTPTTSGSFSFGVNAVDAGGANTSKSYSGKVSSLSITTASLPAPLLSQAYSQTVATSGGNTPITFALTSGALPAGLSLGAGSGLVSGTPTAAGAYAFTISATDTNGGTVAKAFSFTIVAALAITTASLPTPVLTQAYSQMLTTSGGRAPVTFAVTAGALPAGLTLNGGTGAITGTPTTAGAYSFAIKATDANATTATRTYTGTIAAALAITTASLPAPVLSQAYSQSIATSGGLAPVTYAVTSGALPSGLSLNTSNGAVAGTPTSAGSYLFTITATDANATTASRTYTGTIAAALAITTASLPTPVLSQAYSQTVATSGGSAPISFAVTSGSLPSGLSLNTSNGAITGTPTAAGSYSFAVTATDANATAATKTYAGTIAAALTITTASLPTPVLLQAYSQSVATSGGLAPVTFAITSGALPSGLMLSSNGAITGTPTSAGSYSVAITATDANATTASQTYTGAIAPALAITTASLPTPVPSQAYSQSIATTGGLAPVTFAITSGALPTGLSLNTSNGAITGTPTTAGSFSFAITATDANATTASRTYSGAIAAALVITTASLPAPVLSQAYLQTIATSGGSAPVTFAVSSGSLPAGLLLNTSTGAITGTPATAGSYSFAITATDANATSATRSYSGAIAAALTITTASLPTPVLSQAYSQSVATSGGSAPIVFAVTSGALPVGLTLDASTGAIAGVPTVAGSYAFSVTASDALARTAVRTYSGAIAVAIIITTASLPPASPAQPFSHRISIAGGVAPITFRVASGALPTGLALDPNTGAIAGTPMTAGAFAFTVVATDATAASATQSFSGVIAATSAAVSLSASAASVSLGAATTLTAVVTGVSPTGSITFKVGAATLGSAPLNNGSASFTTGALAAGSHTLTASYSGDARNLPAVSAPVVVAVLRPTPAADATVRQLVAAQASAAQRAARTQMDLVQARLERLQGESESCPDAAAAVRGYCIVFDGKASVAAAERTTTEQAATLDLQKAMRTGAWLTTAPTSQMASGRKRDEPIGDAFAAIAPEPVAPAPSLFFATRINVWTAGVVMVGHSDAQGGAPSSRLRTDGVAIGIDMAFSPDLKAGVAFGLGEARATLGANGSWLQAASLGATFYASYQVAPNIYVDATLGQGASRFTERRWSDLASDVVSGRRTSANIYGSLSLAWENRWDRWRTGAYGRLDMVRSAFGAMSETGDPTATLVYAPASLSSTSFAIGCRMAFDLDLSGYRVSPMSRIELVRRAGGSLSQTVAYTNDATSAAAFTTPTAAQFGVQGSLGLAVTAPGHLQVSVEYLFTRASGESANGVRGSLRVPF